MALSDKDIEAAYFAGLFGSLAPSREELVALSGASRLSDARIEKLGARIAARAKRLSAPFEKNIARRAAAAAEASS
jgi:hypothetical protein